MSIPNNDLNYESYGQNSLYNREERLEVDDTIRIIRTCFSIFYSDGIFLEVIHDVLGEHDGGGVEAVNWYYPAPGSPYPEDHFEGICFDYAGDKVYVSDQLSFECAKDACERFMKLHPEEKYRKFITDILDNWIPFDPETMD